MGPNLKHQLARLQTESNQDQGKVYQLTSPDKFDLDGGTKLCNPNTYYQMLNMCSVGNDKIRKTVKTNY